MGWINTNIIIYISYLFIIGYVLNLASNPKMAWTQVSAFPRAKLSKKEGISCKGIKAGYNRFTYERETWLWPFFPTLDQG